MFAAYQNLRKLSADRSGVTAVEYAVLAGALSVGLLAAFSGFSTQIQTFLAGLHFGS